ncbi:hypothetical protein [Nonlabens sp.]|uniref:hypothetical protein n=1 Tax=Nonlabens sp. TaxID=1888209 RepID=UPI0032638E0D
MAYSTKPKIWFWIVAILFLVWNLMGVGAWSAETMASTETLMENYTAEQVAFYSSFPIWYTWAYGIAVFTGVFCCVALLFKRKQAVMLALVSLLAVVICRVYDLSVDSWNMMETVDRTFFIIVPVLSVLLWLFTRNIKAKGWLK